MLDYNELPQARPGQAYVWYLPEKGSWTNRSMISLEYDFVQFAMPLDDMLKEIRSRHTRITKKDKRLKRIVERIKSLKKKLIYYYDIDYQRNQKLLGKAKPMASFLDDY